MRISVVSKFPFPGGLAATVRIRSYLKGLTELGCRTDAFVYQPSEPAGCEPSAPAEGMFDGIHYAYPKSRNYPRHRILRVLCKYYSHWITCGNIWRAHRAEKIDVLLISNDFLGVLFLYTVWARLLKIKPIFITDEYPEPIRIYLKKDIPWLKKLCYRGILAHVDSMIFMTEKLRTFFNTSLRKPSFILPTITDTDRFVGIPRKNNVPYGCYMGNMELSKDNVDNIIIAFGLIAERHPDLQLHLYGAPSQEDWKKIARVIQESPAKDRIVFKGRVSAEDVPEILCNAKVLLSSQPDSKRAEGGFPTKLGEYMATGVPALLCDVGEITQYVQDRVHVCLVPPENPEAYAQRLDEILTHDSEAKAMAQRARAYICENNDYRGIARKLLDFLKGRIS